MNTPTLSPELQGKYEEFVAQHKHLLHKFIGFADEAKIVVDPQAKTFYFMPGSGVIGIPLMWLEKHFASDGKDSYASLEYGKFGMAHEFSHYRDMLKEEEIQKSSMYRVLKTIYKRAIRIDNDKKIPIGEFIHTFYNCTDDIIVNQEVLRFKEFGFDSDIIKSFYKKVNFADYVETPGGNMILDEANRRYIQVEEGTGTHIINLTDTVDYTKIPSYQALSYYFLRSAMVQDQSIKLPKNAEQILFRDVELKKFNTRKKSLESAHKVLQDAIADAKISTDEKIQHNYAKYKHVLSAQLGFLSEKLKGLGDKRSSIPTLLMELFSKIKGQYDPTTKNVYTVSLQDIVSFFTYSKGVDDNHALSIDPNLRYNLYEHLFEPIVTTLIMIDLLSFDPKDMEGKKLVQEDIPGDEEGEGEDEVEGDSEGGAGEGTGGATRRMTIQDKLDILDDAAKAIERKKAEKKLKDLENASKYATSSILDDYEIPPEARTLYSAVMKNFETEIADITTFLYKELECLDKVYLNEKQLSKKGVLNYDELAKHVPNHILDGDFHQEPIYERVERVKQLSEEFKKILIYIVIDISGSTDVFKGPRGLSNGIATSFAVARKNVEKKIQMILRDPTYEIPIKFVVYTDKVVYPGPKDDLKDTPFEIEIAKMNHVITTVNGSTSDVVGRSKVASHIENSFDAHKEYIEALNNGEMKAVVMQIADTDVTENGVELLNEKLETKYGSLVNQRTMKKRIIMGQYRQRKATSEEVDAIEKGGKGNRDITYLKDGKGNNVMKDGKPVIEVRELSISSKSQILSEIKYAFKDFFADLKLKRK